MHNAISAAPRTLGRFCCRSPEIRAGFYLRRECHPWQCLRVRTSDRLAASLARHTKCTQPAAAAACGMRACVLPLRLFFPFARPDFFSSDSQRRSLTLSRFFPSRLSHCRSDGPQNRHSHSFFGDRDSVWFGCLSAKGQLRPRIKVNIFGFLIETIFQHFCVK